MRWPKMPSYGDESYSREEWLLETDPLQLRDECLEWQAIARDLAWALDLRSKLSNEERAAHERYSQAVKDSGL